MRDPDLVRGAEGGSNSSDDVMGVPGLCSDFADLVNRDDVRMIERRGGPRLPRKAPHAPGVGREFGREELDGDFAPQSGIEREMDFTPPASAQRCEQLIPTELSSNDATSRRNSSSPAQA